MDSPIDLDVAIPSCNFCNLGKLDHDGCRSSVHPHMNKHSNRRRLKVVASILILRPFIRSFLPWGRQNQGLQESLKRADDAIQNLIEDFEQPDGCDSVSGQSLSSNSSNLQSFAKVKDEFLAFVRKVRTFTNITRRRERAEFVVRFLDCLVQILQYLCNDEHAKEAETMDVFVLLKNQILDVQDKLKFLGNFLWMIEVNTLSEDCENMKYYNLLFSALKTTVQMFSLLYSFLMNDNMDFVEFISDFEGKIDHLQIGVNENYAGRSRQLLLTDDIDIHNANINMDERVVCFFEFLIDELRKLLPSFKIVADVKDQIEIMVDELSFLRCNLLDILKVEEKPVIKEIKSLCVSMQTLIMDTGYLIYFNRHDNRREKEEERTNSLSFPLPDLLKDIDSPKKQASFFSGSYDKEEDQKQKTDYWTFHLSNLHKAVDSLKQQASDLYGNSNKCFSFSSKSSSSTNKMGHVNFLINNLQELMLSEAASIDPLKHQLQTVYQETVSAKNFLVDHLVKLSSPIDFLARLERAAYQSSYITDLFFAGEGPLWYHKLGMFVIAKDIKIMHRQMKDNILNKLIGADTIFCSFPCPASSQAKNSADNESSVVSKDEKNDMKMEDSPDELVVVKDAATEVIELLTSTGATKLKIISIWGMPGLGKTTLANSVYNHPSINKRFHIRAWCCASQSCEVEALLYEILNQIVRKTSKSHDGEEYFAQELYQSLKGRRYLIVIDDIWDVELWNNLRQIFPDDHKGSRILFTTRHRAVALGADSIPYPLRLLSNEESCELLVSKVFDRETCPPDLLVISKHVARICKGLPLALVLIAGILKRTARKKNSWIQVAETVMGLHQIRGSKRLDMRDLTQVLALSYKHLPDFLKPCFLYLGAVPEVNKISVSKLIRLWISEGFVQGAKALEQTAEEYLNELVDRSLVMIARTSSQSRVKTCRVHDVLREFCSATLEEEKFLSTEQTFGGILFLHSNLERQIRSCLYHCRSDRATGSGQFVSKAISTGSSSLGPTLRAQPPAIRGGLSLSTYSMSERPLSAKHPATRGGLSRGSLVPRITTQRGTPSGVLALRAQVNQPRRLDYSFVLKYKLLRVLDLGNVPFASGADRSDLVTIAKLVQLKYLAIRPRGNEIPTEIGNLQKLQTLVIRGVIGKIFTPESVWNLVSLRHLLSDNGFFIFEHCSKQFLQMDKMRSISYLLLRRGNDVKFILRRLPGIQKLGCRFLADAWDDSTGCSIFPELDFLNELNSLKIFFSGKVQCPCKFSFPSNLTKLSMSNSRLPWDQISVIGRLLPNLEVLKLLNKAFQGQQWDMGAGEFPNLKFLKLESLDVKVWNVSDPDHLPALEQLVVLYCQQLEEIPSSIGEVSTLKLIEMKWCSSSATASARQILEIQRELSNYDLNVTLVGAA